jgi:hypothetical protein
LSTTPGRGERITSTLIFLWSISVSVTICLGYGMTDQTHLLAIVIRYVGAIVHKRRSRDIQQVIEGRLA